MSLDGFHRGLALLVADPGVVRTARAGDRGWAEGIDLSPLERDRLVAMAGDGRMEVLCGLYRSNRLTALVRTVPALVDGLGDRLHDTVSAFWAGSPRTDLQFRSEGAAFCRFVRGRFPEDSGLQDVADEAETALVARYAGTS